MERRSKPRWALHVPVRIRFLNGAIPHAALIDLSVDGCRIQTTGAHPGDHLIVKIHNFAPFSATVVWAQDQFAGLKFDAPLHDAILDHMVPQSRQIEAAGVEELKSIADRCAYLVQNHRGPTAGAEIGNLGRDCRVRSTVAALTAQQS